jgi:hypothetical protein
MHALASKPETWDGNGGHCQPAIPPTDRLVGECSYVHRFDRQPCFLMTVREYETAMGNRYTRLFYEPYQGL